MLHAESPQMRSTGWPALALPALAVSLVAGFSFVWLPAGACFDDSGDLQHACLTLSVAHDPGYAGLVTVGWLLTRQRLIEPAFTVTLACWVAGIAALLLAATLCRRSGAPPVAAAVALMLASLHPAVRDNLVIPEVYAPSAALVLAAAACIMRFEHNRRTTSAWIAGLLLGIAASSRPSIIFMLPGFALGLAAAARIRSDMRKALPPLLAAAAGFVIPCVLAALFLFIRLPARDVGAPPDASPPPKPNVRAVLRCLSGADYTFHRTASGAELIERGAWVAAHIAPPTARIWCVAVVPLALLGLMRTARSSPALAWALSGIVLGNLALLLLVQTGGLAADSLPLVLAAAICCAAGIPTPGTPGRLRIATLFALATATAATIPGWLERPVSARENDAGAFLRLLDIDALPLDSVVVAPWFEATAVRYARAATGRSDVRIVASDDPATQATLAAQLTRPPHQQPHLVIVGEIDPGLEAALLANPSARRVWYDPSSAGHDAPN